MSSPDQLLPVALRGTAMEVPHCRGLAAAEGTSNTYAVISLPLTGARTEELGAYVASPDLAGDLTGVPPTPPKPRLVNTGVDVDHHLPHRRRDQSLGDADEVV
jgi:hypothetical protein